MPSAGNSTGLGTTVSLSGWKEGGRSAGQDLRLEDEACAGSPRAIVIS